MMPPLLQRKGHPPCGFEGEGTTGNEGKGVEEIAQVASRKRPSGSGRKGAVSTIWSATHGKTLLAGTVVICFTVLYILFFAPVLFSGRLLGSGDAIHYYLPNFIIGIAFWNPLLIGGFPLLCPRDGRRSRSSFLFSVGYNSFFWASSASTWVASLTR